MSKKITDEDLELLDELGVEPDSAQAGGSTPREQRIIAGFEEIVRFYEEKGCLPRHGEGHDIFERIYAVRLDSIRQSSECLAVLHGHDKHSLLSAAQSGPINLQSNEEPDDEALLAELGVDSPGDVTHLVHVRSRDEIKAAEEVAKRERCPDFDRFEPIFEKVQSELKTGLLRTLKFQDNAEVNKGDLFILDGHKIIVAEMGEEFLSDYGRPDCRLRVVYDNGTESDLLLRSLQRALNKDKASRRICTHDLGPLFSDKAEAGDLSTGHIYVLRSLSENEFIAKNRSVIHKIGVTGGDVKTRITNAKKDPTFLMAEVEIVASYQLANIDRKKIESLLHGFFSAARLDFELKDRFGLAVEPREWFLVPLPAVEDTIRKLQDGTIGNFRYDTETAQLLPAK